MSALRPSRHQLIPALLLLFCLGLAGLIYIELDQPSIDAAIAKAETTRPREAAAAASDVPGFTMPPIAAYAEVRDRPLFSETRQPAADSPAAPVDPRSSAFNLVGTIITVHEHRALIEHGQPPRLERVSEGQDLDGWSVESIRPDRVILTRADARLEVRIKDVPGAPGPPVPQRARPTANLNIPNIDPSTLSVQAGINLTGNDQPPPPPPPVAPPRQQQRRQR